MSEKTEMRKIKTKGPFILSCSCMQLAIRVQLGEIVRETRRVAKLHAILSIHSLFIFRAILSELQVACNCN